MSEGRAEVGPLLGKGTEETKTGGIRQAMRTAEKVEDKADGAIDAADAADAIDATDVADADDAVEADAVADATDTADVGKIAEAELVIRRPMKLNLKVTPNDAIARLKSNDPTFISCDLSGSAILQMKTAELLPQLAAALGENSVCRELHLVDCSVDDAACQLFAKALQTNSVLAHLNLEGNRVNNEGAMVLARALAVNRGLMLLNLLNQKGSRFGDSTLNEFINCFDTNVTLLKIVWSAAAHRGCPPTELYLSLPPSSRQPLSQSFLTPRRPEHAHCRFSDLPRRL